MFHTFVSLEPIYCMEQTTNFLHHRIQGRASLQGIEILHRTCHSSSEAGDIHLFYCYRWTQRPKASVILKQKNHLTNILRCDTQGCDLSNIKTLQLKLEKDQLLGSFTNWDAAQESCIMSAFEHEAARVPAAAAGELQAKPAARSRSAPYHFCGRMMHTQTKIREAESCSSS